MAARVNSLHKEMNIIVSLLVQVYGCPKDLRSIDKKDFLIIDGDLNTTQKEISYSVDIYEGKIRKTGFKNYGTLDDIVKNSIKEILKEIEYIKNYEYLYATCTEFMENIRNIEVCSFIRCYHKKIENSTKCFLYNDSNVMLEEFVNLFLRLNKLKFHTKYSIITLDSENETQKYHDDRASGKYIKNIMEAREKEYKKAMDNRTIILTDDDYYANIIQTQIKRSVTADYLTVNKVSTSLFENYKYAIIIVGRKKLKDFFKLLHGIETPIKIIFIMENYFGKRNYEKEINNSNIEVVNIFFYKKTKPLWNTHFYINKKEPSEKTIKNIINDVKAIILETN